MDQIFVGRTTARHCNPDSQVWRLFGKESSTPAGVPAISRGLSAATSPVVNRESNCTLEGCQHDGQQKKGERYVSAAFGP